MNLSKKKEKKCFQEKVEERHCWTPAPSQQIDSASPSLWVKSQGQRGEKWSLNQNRKTNDRHSCNTRRWELERHGNRQPAKKKEQPACQPFSLPPKAVAATYDSPLHPIGRDNHFDHRSAVCGQDSGQSHIETGKGDSAACWLKVTVTHTQLATILVVCLRRSPPERR